MNKKGRKSKYESHVKPYLAEIEKWCESMTEAQIARKLGVSYRSWCDYKLQFPQLSQTLKKGRQDLVIELRSALIKRAKGFTYEEKKLVTESDGRTRKEIVQKYYPPDVAALNLALKNYDRDNWANDPQMLRIREKELELREKQIDANAW